MKRVSPSPLRHAKRALGSVILCVMTSLLLCVSLPAQQQRPVIHLVGHPDAAPDFLLASLDGKPVSLVGARGKVILLNFWATWCGPCRAETPDLIELQKRYQDSLQIIGLAVDVDDPADLQTFVESSGINYPIAVASDDVRIHYGGIAALPTSFLIDTEGRIVQKHVGLFNPVLFELEIRALLHLAVPVDVETFEDTGQIFLKNADRATELPGVDFTGLSTQQRLAALRAFNAEACTCGCKLTLAQCRIYDSACHVSRERTAEIVKQLSAAPATHEAPSPQTPASTPPKDPAPPPPAASSRSNLALESPHRLHLNPS